MTTHTIFRLVHILSGILWVGAAVFIAQFLLPSARAIGPAAGPMMNQLTEIRKVPVFLQIVGLLTILSGGVLAYRDAGPLGFHWFSMGSGRVFGVGAIAAVVASVLGMAVSAPAAKRLGALMSAIKGAGRAPTAEEQGTMVALQDRLYSASRWGAVLLLVAATAMAGARYL